MSSASSSVINQVYQHHHNNPSNLPNPSMSNACSPLSSFSATGSIPHPTLTVANSTPTISSLAPSEIHAASVLNRIGLPQNSDHPQLSSQLHSSQQLNTQNLFFNQTHQIKNENEQNPNSQLGGINTTNNNGLSNSPPNHASLLSAAGLLYPTTSNASAGSEQQKISPIASSETFSATPNPAAFFDYSSYAAAAQVAAAQASCQMGIGGANNSLNSNQALHANSQQYATGASEMDFWKLQFFTREFEETGMKMKFKKNRKIFKSQEN